MAIQELHNEQELLRQMASGDQAAFSLLYQHYWPRLFIYVMRTVRSEADTEDIIQELFSTLWKRRTQLAIQGGLAPYLFSSARYMSIAYIEKNISRSNYLERLTHLQQQVSAPDAEMDLRIKELQQQLSAAIDALPPRMREIFILSRKEQLSQKEIAEQLGISEQTVKKQVQSALKVVRASMDKLPGALFLLGL